MAKKKKLLPKNFKELIEKGDIEALKKVFDSCELDAIGGYAKSTALSFYGIQNEFLRWFVEKGADIGAVDIYGRTALHCHCMHHNSDITVFLELGANVDATDKHGSTPLHMAAGNGYNVAAVKKLIRFGANPNALDSEHLNPLERALKYASNIHIVNLVEISKILLETGIQITQQMKEFVISKGKDFEFHRENYNKDRLKATDEAITRLYQIYDVVPVKRRVIHDGVSMISVKANGWEEQFEELWQLLVPSSGSAKTVQGEVVRLAGKIRDEILRNGGGNWDNEFRKMLDAFLKYISTGNSLQTHELKKVDLIAKNIRKNGYGNDDDLDFICQTATKWVLNNLSPFLLETTEYRR